MKIVTVALALGTALVVCTLGTFTAAAQARKTKVVREPQERLYVPVVRPTPWDYYIVPRYRYRPEDDRIDPYGPPPVPVVRYGPQESTVIWPGW
jgi:ABC-type amino acid transport system permease subunit